jgi:phosphoribosylglycinamide formyltransferase 2
LGLPIAEIRQVQNGASAVVLATQNSESAPQYRGLDKVLSGPNAEVRIFGKPTTRPYRRMAVALAFGPEKVEDLVQTAKKHAANIQMAYANEKMN